MASRSSPVAMDDEGLEPDALEQALGSGEKPAFLYTIPTFQNPSGRTLSDRAPAPRSSSSRASTTCSCWRTIPTASSATRATAPPTLFELEGGERVTYSSSFSKTIAPGLRVGYFVLPAALERELEALAVSTYITPVLLGQATVFEFLRRGNFEPNLERVRSLLGARRDAMLEALERRAPRCPLEPSRGWLLHLARAARGNGRDRVARSCRRGGRDLRARPGFRRGPEHRSARLQLRLARRDPRRRAPARGARARCPSRRRQPGRSRREGEARGAAGAAERASRGCAAGTSDRVRQSAERRARRDGSSSPRRSSRSAWSWFRLPKLGRGPQ